MSISCAVGGLERADGVLAEVYPFELAAIYRDHAGAVYRVARMVVGPAAAEDVTQEVFLTYWQRPNRFDASRGSLRTFLLTIARYRAVDVVRSEAARSARQQRFDGERSQPQAVDTPLLARDDAEAVRAALSELAPGVREAICITFYGGLTYREAARALGEPEGTIKSRIRSGLRQLRAGLGGFEFDRVTTSNRA